MSAKKISESRLMIVSLRESLAQERSDAAVLRERIRLLEQAQTLL